MKRKFFGMTGMLAVLLLALGLVLAGCPTDSDNSGGGGGGGTVPTAKSKLTINGIPSEHNGKYVLVMGTVGEEESTMLLGLTDVTGMDTEAPVMKVVKIADGKAVVPLYYSPDGTSVVAYEGNDTLSATSALAIYVFSDDDGSLTSSEMPNVFSSSPTKIISSGTFSSGNLTYTWQ